MRVLNCHESRIMHSGRILRLLFKYHDARILHMRHYSIELGIFESCLDNRTS